MGISIYVTLIFYLVALQLEVSFMADLIQEFWYACLMENDESTKTTEMNGRRYTYIHFKQQSSQECLNMASSVKGKNCDHSKQIQNSQGE